MKIKLKPIIPKQQLAKVTPPAKITSYGLEERVWQWLMLETKGIYEVTDLCNQELKNRNDGLFYEWITPINIMTYLSTIKNKVRKFDDKKFHERLLDTIDVLTTLEEAVHRVEERSKEAYEKDDVKVFAQLELTLREHLRLLAQLQGKLKTYISIDMLNVVISQVANVVSSDRLLPPVDKRRLLGGLKNVIEEVLKSTERTQLTDPGRLFTPIGKTNGNTNGSGTY